MVRDDDGPLHPGALFRYPKEYVPEAGEEYRLEKPMAPRAALVTPIEAERIIEGWMRG